MTNLQIGALSVVVVAAIFIVGWGFRPQTHYESLAGDTRPFQKFVALAALLILAVACEQVFKPLMIEDVGGRLTTPK